ncbi:MAG: redox-sensing transcriptional repressor Rex [Ruminococcaceae bacterium]|nr:redox-sensing transcriptional repressor Rex [Oscillospiraceae bacterium]
MQSKKNISMSVIKRLPRYYRFLGNLGKKNIERISSLELSRQMGLTASQIRQDLNCFGGFGQQGYGYNVKMLYEEIGAILGVNNKNKTILIGTGNLGQAIARHMSFEMRGFNIIGIFDREDSLVGTELRGLRVQSTDSLENFCKENSPLVAVLCVPNTTETEELIDLLVDCGIKAFWNFTHIDIKAKYLDVCVENVHLSDSLMTLCYQVNMLKK